MLRIFRALAILIGWRGARTWTGQLPESGQAVVGFRPHARVTPCCHREVQKGGETGGVENIAGNSGALATTASQGAPDGYTLMWAEMRTYHTASLQTLPVDRED